MLGVHVYIPCHFLGISEPVLQEEGSLIAGWRAKFGEENQSADSFVFDVIVGNIITIISPICVIQKFSVFTRREWKKLCHGRFQPLQP